MARGFQDFSDYHSLGRTLDIPATSLLDLLSKLMLVLATVVLSSIYAMAQETVRFSIYAPPSSLTTALENDIRSAPVWAEIGKRAEFVTPQLPYESALLKGVVDIAYVPIVAAQRQAIKSLGFSEPLVQPFGSASSNNLIRILNGPYRDFLLADLEHKEAYAVALGTLGASTLVAQVPIATLADVKGSKWALTEPLGNAFQAFGVDSQILPQTDMQSALFAGAVDAIELLYPEDVERVTAQSSGLAVVTNFQPMVVAAMTRPDFWETISEDERLKIEAVLARAETQSVERAERSLKSLYLSLAERKVSQISTFSELLNPETRDNMRSQWLEGAESRNFVLEMFDAAIESQTDPDDISPGPSPDPDNQSLPVRKIWFGTDRVLNPNPRSFESMFGIRQVPQQDSEFYCGAFSWEKDAERPLGVPITNTLNFDGAIQSGADCNALLASLAAAGNGKVLLFIHGYNTRFEAAAARSAALKEDLNWEAPIILWSWPSRGSPGAYEKDERTVASSRWRLIPFLRAMWSAGFERIDLVAHSMGSRLGIEILTLAGSEQPTPFKQAIFVAPDVASSDFAGAVTASNYPGGMAVYANAHDRALILSMLRRGESRAGLAGEYSIMMPGLETIDASEIDFEAFPDLNHSHAFDVSEGVADLKARLASDDTAPGQRNLRREPIQGDPSRWVIKLDPQLRAAAQ